MEVPSFSPGSLFGVPLNAIPPGMRWHSVRDMLHEVLSELHRGWVRRYLLEADALADAAVISSTDRQSESARFSSHARANANWSIGTEALSVSHSLLLIPARTVDDLGAGVGIERFDVVSASSLVRRPARVVRFVVNNRTGASTVVAHRDDAVELAFHDLRDDGSQTHVCLELHRNALRKALANPDRIDFASIECALISTMVGETTGAAHSTGLQLRSRAKHYPFRLTMSDGDVYFRNVRSIYCDGTPVSTAALFVHANGEYNMASDTARTLTDWGMRDCLERACPVVQAPIPSATDDSVEDTGNIDDLVDDLTIDAQCLANDFEHAILASAASAASAILTWHDSNSNVDLELQECRSDSHSPLSLLVSALSEPESNDLKRRLVAAVPPAAATPAPRRLAALIAPASEPAATARAQYAGEDEKLRKVEQRKIRKREAAARCNARRKAKRLAEQKKNQANTATRAVIACTIQMLHQIMGTRHCDKSEAKQRRHVLSSAAGRGSASKKRTVYSAIWRNSRVLHINFKLSHESFDLSLDLIAHNTHGVDTLSVRVSQRPVFISFARDERAFVTTAHTNDDVDGLYHLICPFLGLCRRYIDLQLRHRLYCYGIHGRPWCGAGRVHRDAVAAVVAQEAGRHLRTACVMRAQEEDSGRRHLGGAGRSVQGGARWCDAVQGEDWRDRGRLWDRGRDRNCVYSDGRA
eukprot:IDg9357t1